MKLFTKFLVFVILFSFSLFSSANQPVELMVQQKINLHLINGMGWYFSESAQGEFHKNCDIIAYGIEAIQPGAYPAILVNEAPSYNSDRSKWYVRTTITAVLPGYNSYLVADCRFLKSENKSVNINQLINMFSKYIRLR